MSPVEIEERVRQLELMLYGGCPVRPNADFGQQEVGHFDGVKARSPDVKSIQPGAKSESEVVVERFIVASDGKMSVDRSRPAKDNP